MNPNDCLIGNKVRYFYKTGTVEARGVGYACVRFGDKYQWVPYSKLDEITENEFNEAVYTSDKEMK